MDKKKKAKTIAKAVVLLVIGVGLLVLSGIFVFNTLTLLF